MKVNITSIASLVLLAGLLSANSAFAVDDAAVQEINNKASSANAKADGNKGRIGAIEADIAALGAHHEVDIAAVTAAIGAVELMPGPAGEDGTDGAPGADGADGATGAAGAAGADGTNGVDGAPGADGVDGAPGADGNDGADGTNGTNGAPGAPGADGADGTNGVDGSDGAPGDDGADGAPGTADGAPQPNMVGDGFGVPLGDDLGDLLYWNGTSWIATIPALAVTGVDKHQPSLGVNYVIALVGTFPSRNAVDPLLGEIMLFAGNFAPRGWAFCNGQILPINQNQSLYSLLGTTYGGDGRVTFGLPDLRGRVPVGVEGFGADIVSLGDRFGSEDH